MKSIFFPNQRIIILQGLEEDPDHSLTAELLQRLLKSMGHNISLSETNVQINWLEERGYLNTERLENGIVKVILSRPGLDVALGNLRAEGIDPPIKD